MSQEIEKRFYNNIALPKAEISVLKELEEILGANGSLSKGELIPLVKRDLIERSIAFAVENNVVVALALRYCKLTSLPESFGQLSHLRFLDMTGNSLTSLPTSFGNLHHLKKLLLDGNQLASLPASLGSLQHLEELHADRNALTALPECLYELTHLKTLSVYGNKLISLLAKHTFFDPAYRGKRGEKPTYCAT